MSASKLGIPSLFLWLGIPLGLIFAFLSPPFQIPDEIYHFFRAYSVSTGACVPPADRAVPEAFHTVLVNVATANWSGHFRDYPHFLATLLRGSNVPGNFQADPNLYNSLYTCFPYLASATGVEAGKAVSGSVFTLMYAGRLANLALYLLLTYLALRIIPVCRTALFALALMPMSLQQAASVSADSATIASAFLYSAYLFYLAYDQRIKRITPVRLAILGGLLLFASLCKLNLPFILLPLLIPAARFGATRIKLATVAAALVLVVSATAAWQWLDRTNVRNFQAARVVGGIDSKENIRFIADHPVEFAAALDRTVQANALEYLIEFVGRLGLVAIPLPIQVVWGYTLILLLLAVGGSESVRLAWPDRLLGATVGAASILTAFVMIWGLESTQSFLSDQILRDHNGWIMGFQGRYLIPIAPVFFLAISGGRPLLSGRAGALMAGAMVLIGATAAVASIYNFYFNPQAEPAAAVAPVGKVSRPGIYRKGVWLWHGVNTSPVRFGGLPQDIPVTGDWTGSGVQNIGVYRSGMWLLDSDGDGQFTAKDQSFNFGGLPGDVPVPGDWTGDGRAKLGIYRNGAWLLDVNGDGAFDANTDRLLHFGGLPGDIPVVGDWTGDKRDKIGIFRQGYLWILDVNGNGIPDASDQMFAFGGIPGDLPVVGDWTGSGRAKVGIFRQGYFWILDANNNHQIDASGPGRDSLFPFGGLAGDKPVVRKW